MAVDLMSRLAGTSANPPVGQSIAAATTAGLLTEHWRDLKGARAEDLARSLAEGEELCGKFLITTALAAAVANLTCDFRLVTLPKASLAAVVFTAAGFATDTLTSAGHGMSNGTVLTVATATTLPAGLAASTHYYVRDAATDTFKLALTPDGAAVDITDAGTGAHTFTVLPTIVASSGPVPGKRLIAGHRVQVRMNPLHESPIMPRHRYLFGMIVPSANLSAGAWVVDLGTRPDVRVDYPSGVVA